MATVKALVDVMPAWQIGLYWGSIGVLYGAMLTMLTAAIQHHAPQSQLGAVSSRVQNIRLLALVAGPLAGGLDAKHLGIDITIASAAGIGLVCALKFASRRSEATRHRDA